MTTNIVIPYGYASDIAKGYGTLDEIMSVPKTVLVDVRLKSFSSKEHPEWNGTALESHYGRSRYIHIEALGNLNYKTGGEFKLKDSRAGLERLRQGLARGYRLVILCGCRDYTHCHRSLVVQLLAAEVPGLQVRHPEKMVPLVLVDGPLEALEPVVPIKVEQPALFAEPAVWRDI